jgi:diguanylate cyclase (GGDEF)-like protein
MAAEEVSELISATERQKEALRVELNNAETMLDMLHLLLDPDRSDKPFQRVFALLAEMFAADVIVAARYKPSEDRFQILDAMGVPERYDLPNGPFMDKIVHGKVRSVIDLHMLSEWEHAPASFAAMRTGLFVPLKDRLGDGILAIMRREGQFSNKDLALAKRFSMLASHAFASANAIEQRDESDRLRELMKDLAESQEQLRQLALYDRLSGLPNRVQLEHLTNMAVAAHKKDGQSLAFVYMDLNDFKLVNDYHGHDGGDELIACVAMRLANKYGDDAIVSRVSGDEFAVVLKNIDETTLSAQLHELDKLFDRPFQLSFGTLYITACLGAAIYPRHGEDFAALRRKADSAMYAAKCDQRCNWKVFDRSMATASMARMDLAQQVRLAVQQDQTECWMQPQVNTHDGRIGGFECLTRLRYDDGILAHTGKVIQIASETGLLDQLTFQNLEKVLARLDEIRAAHPGARISFNVAPFQACDDEFVRRLIHRLSEAGCIDMMTMEITEDAVLGTSIFENRILPILRKAGLEVAIDDFGTGYSSLSLIGGLPINELKIDRSFIQTLTNNANQLAVLRSICTLAGDLDLRVVAEGIETIQQKQALDDLNVSLVQGFLYGRPAPIQSWLS